MKWNVRILQHTFNLCPNHTILIVHPIAKYLWSWFFTPPRIYFYALLQILNESLLLDEKRQTSQIGELNKYMAQNRDKSLQIYLFNAKYFKYIFVWSKIFQMYICLIKNISNICLLNPTNRDSDLSRLPPSWGRQNLVDEHLSSNYRHLASWERGEDPVPNLNENIGVLLFGVKPCPRTRRKYWHLPNPVLLTTPSPKSN